MSHIHQNARPFLRWAGSKRLLISKLSPFFPSKFGTYHEPFLGSGAVFFHLQPKRAVLSDANQELISTYIALRDNPQKIINQLLKMSPDEATYYAIRNKPSNSILEQAIEFIYINRLCFNGIYRVNSKGRFNVPYGGKRVNYNIDSHNLTECSKILKNNDIEIFFGDFSENIKKAQPGDFVFLDPPYVTSHNFNGFAAYNESIFSWKDQLRLAECIHNLKERDVAILLTNADHESVLDLYPNFRKSKIERFSGIASDSSKRKIITESVITFLPQALI